MRSDRREVRSCGCFVETLVDGGKHFVFAPRGVEIEKKFGEVPNFFGYVKMSSCNGLGEWRVPILQQALCVFARPLWEQIPCGA